MTKPLKIYRKVDGKIYLITIKILKSKFLKFKHYRVI
jgi:hypothetical protein